MEKISFFGEVPKIEGTYIEEHAKRIKKVADFLLKKCNNHGLEFDFTIQITHFANFNSYWLRLLFFVKNEPDHTTTLFTVRVFDRGDINTPITLDMNLVDEEEVDLEKIDCVDNYEEDANLDEMTFECYSEEDFELKVNYLSKIAFEKMAKNLREYIDYQNEEE